MDWADPQLDAGCSRHAQPGAGCGDRGRLGPKPRQPTKRRCRINKGHYAYHAATCLTFTAARKPPNAAAITPSADFANSVQWFLIHSSAGMCQKGPDTVGEVGELGAHAAV